MTLVKMFKEGDLVRTTMARTEDELMNCYAFAANRDVTGTFKVDEYCWSGNGAIRLVKENGESPYGMPLWVNQAELTLAEDTTAPVAVKADRYVGMKLNTTGVAKECEAGDVVRCEYNVSFLLTRGEEYTVIEKDGVIGIESKCGMFYSRGHSEFVVVKLAEPETVKLVELAPPAPAFEAPLFEAFVEAIDTDNKDMVKFGEMPRDQALALVEAYLDDKEMQYYDQWDEAWYTLCAPSFRRDGIFRVKPELTEAQKRVIALKEEIAELEAAM